MCSLVEHSNTIWLGISRIESVSEFNNKRKKRRKRKKKSKV